MGTEAGVALFTALHSKLYSGWVCTGIGRLGERSAVGWQGMVPAMRSSPTGSLSPVRLEVRGGGASLVGSVVTLSEAGQGCSGGPGGTRMPPYVKILCLIIRTQHCHCTHYLSF